MNFPFNFARRTRRTVIVVLGARSGTSALAGTLGLIGCALPRNLMAANWANPKGYFEPQDIASLHDEILNSVGSSWSDFREFPPAWYQSAAAAEYRAKLAETFNKNFDVTELAVLKEPRMCRLLPLWDGIFQDLGISPAYCFIDRHPNEVAASLQARDGSSLSQGLLYYLRNHFDAEYATRGQRRAFLSYDYLLRDWRHAVALIADRLKVRFSGIDEAKDKVDAFLDRHLRHQAADSSALPSDPLSVMADTVHAIFGQLSTEKKEPKIYTEMDQLRADFSKLY